MSSTLQEPTELDTSEDAIMAKLVRRPFAPLTNAITNALKAVLPTVDETWYGRMPHGSTDALVTLAQDNDTHLALAALDAIHKAGDGSSAPDIERLARFAVSAKSRERARAILPRLVGRHERELSPTILLRPSDSGAEKHLVRPVPALKLVSEELLRSRDADLIQEASVKAEIRREG